MVKQNPDDTGLHTPSLVLEDSDREQINEIISEADVGLKETEISNPSNRVGGLYIQVWSYERGDVLSDKTVEVVKKAAESVGYNSNKFDRSNFPSKKKPTEYDDRNDEYYTMTFWFTSRN